MRRRHTVLLCMRACVVVLTNDTFTCAVKQTSSLICLAGQSLNSQGPTSKSHAAVLISKCCPMSFLSYYSEIELMV